MAVTITDNRSLVDHADATTGWSSPVAGEGVSVFTSAPSPVELSGCLGVKVSNATVDVLHTHSSTDLSGGVLVYVWVFPQGVVDTTANGGVQALIGDGTDTIGYDTAGSDKAAFRHADGPVNWQCLLLDTGNLPAGFTAARGTEANLTLTAITEFGAQFKTLVKSVGGVENCFIDTIRYGNGGLDVLGGTTGDRGSFLEIAVEDRDDTSGKAYGGFRELGAGVYGCQIALTFGETGTASHYFQDADFVVNWEDRGQAAGRFDLTLQSNATGVGVFHLGLINGTENGTNGGSLIQTAASGCTFDASAAEFDDVLLYDVTLKNWTGGVLFSDDATNGVGHDVFDCLIDTCGTVNPGRVDMKNCTVVNSSATTAMIFDDTDNTLIARISFISDGTGHAMRIRPVGAGPFSFSFDGFSASGYASTDGSTGNETVLIDPVTTSADVTINLTNATGTFSKMEAAGYTGTSAINQTVTLTVQVNDDAGAGVSGAAVRIERISDGSLVANGTTDATGEYEDTSFSYTSDLAVRTKVRKKGFKPFRANGTIVSTGLTVAAPMGTDDIVDLP